MDLLDIVWVLESTVHYRTILEAFDDQSVGNFRLHIVDTTGTVNGQGHDDYINIIPAPGLDRSAAKNLGVLASTSPRVLIHEDGCLPVPTHVESHVVHSSRLVVCYGAYHVVESLDDLSSYLPDPRLMHDRALFLGLDGEGREIWWWATGCVSFPRRVIVGLGGFRSFSRKNVEDADMARRCAQVGCDVRVLPHAGVYGIKAPVLDAEAICEAEIGPLYHESCLSEL